MMKFKWFFYGIQLNFTIMNQYSNGWFYLRHWNLKACSLAILFEPHSNIEEAFEISLWPTRKGKKK